MKKMLIGLTAPARAGKDSTADIMCRNNNFQKYSLASPIKDFFDMLFHWGTPHRDGELKEEKVIAFAGGVDFDNCWAKFFPQFNPLELQLKFNFIFNPYIKKTGKVIAYYISPRVAYQLFGTEFGRSLSDTVWIDLAKAKLEALDKLSLTECDTIGLVIPDVRFQNEADWIRSTGGVLIHIKRPSVGGVAVHSSEAGIEPISGDIILHNDGNLDKLEKAVGQVFLEEHELRQLYHTNSLFLEYV